MRSGLLAVALALAACTPDLPVNLHPVRLPDGNTPVRVAATDAPADPSPAPASPSPTGTPSNASPPSPVTVVVSAAPSPTAAPTATPTPIPPTPSPAIALVRGTQPADTWQTGPSLQRPRAGLVAAAFNGALFALEGESRASLEILGADADGWALSAPVPAPGQQSPIGRRLQAVGFDAKRLVAAGGDDADVRDDVLSYTPDGAEVAGRLTAPAMAAAAGLLGDTLAVAGGLDKDRKVTGAVQRLNLQDQTTQAGQAMPQAVAGAASAVLNGKLYVIGGYMLAPDGSATPQAAVQVYDIASDTWQRDGDGKAGSPPAIPTARHSAAAAALGGKIYLVGGAGTGNGVIDDVEVYDPVANKWQAVQPIPTARALHALAAYGGRLWAIGGRGADGGMLTSVEIYHP